MKRLLLLCALICAATFKINAQAFEWAKKFPAPFTAPVLETSNSLHTDGKSLIFSSFFNDSIQIGNQLYYHSSGALSNSTSNNFLVKYDLGGAILWSKHLGGGGISYINTQIDSDENIIIAGYYEDSLTIDSTLFISPGYSFFIVKLSSAGNLMWARNSQAPVSPLIGGSRLLNFDLDSAGNVYITGYYNYAIRFDHLTLTDPAPGPSSQRHFLLKYNKNGILQWLNDLGNTGGLNDNIAVSDQGDVYHAVNSFYTTGFLRKYNTNGILQWSRVIPKSNNAYGDNSLGVSETGYVYLGCSFDAPITLGSFNLPVNNSAPFKPNFFLAKIDQAGNWVWVKEMDIYYTAIPKRVPNPFTMVSGFNKPITIGDSSYTAGHFSPGTLLLRMDSTGSILQVRRLDNTRLITTDPANNTYLLGRFSGSINLGNTQLQTAFSTPAFFLTKLLNYSNALTGTVYRDSNSNGIKDTAESPYAERILEITPGPIYVSTLPNGDYGTFLPADTFSISMPNPPRHYNVAPASHNFAFSGVNQSISGKDFAVQPVPNMDDASVNLMYSVARPGRSLMYRLTYTNMGTTVLSDSIRLNFNSSVLTYDSSSVVPATQKTGQLSWYYQNLQPNEKRSINVYLYVDSTTTLGTPLQAIAAIKPFAIDKFVQDNYDTLNHVVVTSFDPNDKQVNRAVLTPAQVLDQPYLNYTIRFQNTGTDTAFTVIIRDEFSFKLYVPSFELLSASHPYTFRLLENGMAEWRFDNILLPDSNRNEPASHGFIRYRMQPKNNLVLGDEIKSRAAIYFDYNAPVLTNYAVTTVSLTNGIKEKFSNIQTFKLYPNPAKNYVMVAADFKKNTSATVSLLNLLGQTLSNVTLPANNQIHYQLPLNDLPKGIYLIRLETETGMQTQRLVIQ